MDDLQWEIERNRISLLESGGRRIAYVSFPDAGPKLVDVEHTVVLPEAEGRGLAGRLMKALAQELRGDGRKAKLSCPYAVRWFSKNPEEADVLRKEC